MESQNIEKIDTNRTCCANCKWFQESNRFCRLNPPVPMNVRIGEQLVVTSMFPKIPVPGYDYCSHFKKDITMI